MQRHQIYSFLFRKIPPEIISDPKILRQIILNLVNNAVKFTEKGHVNIKIDYIENDQLPALLLLVEDTGIGIPTEKQSSIFDRFAQVDALRTRRYGGTGLGLALVKEYIQTLGGTINLKSELGKGTLFICQIPIKLIPVENPQTIKIEAIDKNINTGTTPIKRVLVSTPQILIVEDEPIIQRIHKAMLEQFLFTVDIAATGKQALSLYDKKDYDLIFMDIGLPDMDGFDITRQIRLKQAHRSHSSIVAITAYDNNQDREKCFLAGMDDVIIKPVNLQQLKQIVDKFLKYS
ncbi:MAG: response regulator [Coxiellaceae bacterium]|nr:MAG: response regulator [Coxiellaceae bacterium]